MIACHIRYEIDPNKLDLFEQYARMWIPLVHKFGGVHHGYFLPSEGRTYETYAVFSFASLAAYESYRNASFQDEACLQAFEFASRHQLVIKSERQFMKPILE